MNLKTENKLLSTFNFSSLTDIVLLLLIFFLLSSSFIVQPGIKVKLPQSETSEMHTERSITVSVLKDGSLYLNDELVTLGTLPALLQQELKRKEQQVIVIKADKDIMFQRVVEVMDLAKKAGAVRFLIATERM
ncbi:biopolymer transporter ExbD [candidate division KSB1 bacterium]|nr:MAG: biopolymer transporter ExbD [candidate division KSB1 bacterium]